jgi:uncharacterized protein (DUF608 family)
LVPSSDEALDALGDQELEALVKRAREYAFVEQLVCSIQEVEAERLANRAGRIELLKEIRRRVEIHSKQCRNQEKEWGAVALASQVRARPGQEQTLRFALSWHFPYHYSPKGNVLGHMYENWFADAEAVNRFLVEKQRELAPKVQAFSEALYDTTLDSAYPDAWAGQLTTLSKCTWWTKDGDFGVWEGLGCCGFHTTDITYQGSFNILALYPDLQKKQMEMGARFQREDGRVHHFFVPDFSAVDNGFDRVDMNQQFVLLACRDYLWTGDREYLQRLWPHIVRAMENTARLDADGDGLPDQDTRRNTYDAWNFFGTPSYIASLWVSALAAAERLAAEMGDAERGATWRELRRRAVAACEQKLWNGRYYRLCADGANSDETCMTDQVDGEWFTSVIGLGFSLPRERLVAAMRQVMALNFSHENGLVNATTPEGCRRHMASWRNIQAMAPWTGIEYAMASLLLELGLHQEARAVVRCIHDRHLRAGRFWNHVECGDHYYRAMSSWAVLLSATGFRVDAPRGRLEIAPAVPGKHFRAPWFSTTGWGVFSQGPNGLRLSCADGALEFSELELRLRSAKVKARLDGKVSECTARREASGRLVLKFAKPVRMRPGARLEIAAQ